MIGGSVSRIRGCSPSVFDSGDPRMVSPRSAKLSAKLRPDVDACGAVASLAEKACRTEKSSTCCNCWMKHTLEPPGMGPIFVARFAGLRRARRPFVLPRGVTTSGNSWFTRRIGNTPSDGGSSVKSADHFPCPAAIFSLGPSTEVKKHGGRTWRFSNPSTGS